MNESINISVPPEFKIRLKKFKKFFNSSKVCRDALEEKIIYAEKMLKILNKKNLTEKEWKDVKEYINESLKELINE